MLNTFVILLFIPLLSLATPKGMFIPAAMFENSARRDAYPNEKHGIVKITTNFANKVAGRCTGYFIKNANNRFFIASAQHCAKYDFEKYCKAQSIHVTTASRAFKGYCESVIISHEKSDFVIFEARFADPDEVLRNIQFLTLADNVPSGGTLLKLIGYPGDEERKGQLTVSEKCSVLSTNRTALQELTEEEVTMLNSQKITRAPAPGNKARSQKPTAVEQEAALARKRSADIKKYAVKKLHNCSVYGGNSGGPLLIFGTSTVIGMPMNYLRMPVARKFPENSGMHFETTQSFIENNRRAFDDYKITTIKELLGILI